MEELKIIMEALSGLGAEAKTAFIVWVLAKYVLHYLTTSVLVGGLFVTVYKIAKPVVTNNLFLEQIKAVMGFAGFMISSERKEIIKALSDYKNKEKE